ncbi:hypothetical protein LINPERHAP1_LOCUS1430 [Linum perenne]
MIYDIDTITKIRMISLPREGVDDKLIWHYAASGAYIVQSRYEVASGKFSPIIIFGPTSMVDKTLWDKVWSLQVQPKLQIFLCKILKGIIPTRGNINKRFTIQIECPVCLVEEESSEHLFMRCILAKKLAKYVKINTHPYDPDCVIYSWRKLFRYNMKIQVEILLLWWRIWKSRNNVIFNRAQTLPDILG